MAMHRTTPPPFFASIDLNWMNILGIAVGLAMDAFAVSIAAGLALPKVTPRHVFRLGFHFGLFQFFMPIIGWWAGSTISDRITDYDHWIALGLLSFIGLKMLIDAFRPEDHRRRTDPTRGWTLVTLSVATSIDALAVGVGLAFLDVPILLPCVVVGLVAAIFSSVGIMFGSRLGRSWGRGAEILGGCTLILVGLHILWSHLTG